MTSYVQLIMTYMHKLADTLNVKSASRIYYWNAAFTIHYYKSTIFGAEYETNCRVQIYQILKRWTKFSYSSIMSHTVIKLWFYIHILIHCLPVISAPVEVETMQQITKSDATIFSKVDCWIEDVYIEGIGVLYLLR